MQRIITNPNLRDTVMFVRTSAESGGLMTELEATVMPGGSNPPHFHKTYAETITVLEGAVQLNLAKGVSTQLAAGDSYIIRAGETHGFRNATDHRVRVLSQITPGSEGFEDALRILYGLAGDGLFNQHKMPRSLQHFAICASISDTRFPGLMSVFNPLIEFVARVARWRGVEDELRRKYCV